MPYTKEHKARSREKILQSAHELFNLRGFDAVTVDEVMANCAMTRGAFYAHFKNKADLYNQTFRFSIGQTKLAGTKPDDMSEEDWLNYLLEGYLCPSHVNGERPCPVAFLSSDVVNRNKDTRTTYTRAYKGMNRVILAHVDPDTPDATEKVLSLTAMMVGAVAIARAVDDENLKRDLLSACRQEARALMGWQA